LIGIAQEWLYNFFVSFRGIYGIVQLISLSSMYKHFVPFRDILLYRMDSLCVLNHSDLFNFWLALPKNESKFLSSACIYSNFSLQMVISVFVCTMFWWIVAYSSKVCSYSRKRTYGIIMDRRPFDLHIHIHTFRRLHVSIHIFLASHCLISLIHMYVFAYPDLSFRDIFLYRMDCILYINLIYLCFDWHCPRMIMISLFSMYKF